MKRGKKFISLFLVFSIMMLSVNLHAKGRRGVKLVVTKKDGHQAEGELFTVKSTSLLLLDTAGKDVSIDIADIKVIRIVKKSKVGKGALTGFINVASISLALCVFGIYMYGIEDISAGDLFLGSAKLGIIGASIGALIGISAGADEIIQLEGMTEQEIQKALDYLRKKAHIRDYK